MSRTHYTALSATRLRNAFQSLIGTEATVVVECSLGEADWRTRVVPVEWDEYGVSWRIPPVEFDVTGLAGAVWTRWTVYNDRWEAVFEDDELNVTTLSGDTKLVLDGISASLDLPQLASHGRVR